MGHLPLDLTLQRDQVRLEPLTAEHARGLAALVDAELWAGMTSPLPATPAQMASYVEAAVADPGRIPFAVVDRTTGDVRGSTSYYDLVVAQQRVEIGHTFYGRRFWGGRTNALCKLLLLGYAFDDLGLYRVGLRCDARNTRSAAAITRLGATREGVLRGHRVAADGSRADSVYFSVLAPEWPGVRAGLEQRLQDGAPGGVDATGAGV